MAGAWRGAGRETGGNGREAPFCLDQDLLFDATLLQNRTQNKMTVRKTNEGRRLDANNHSTEEARV